MNAKVSVLMGSDSDLPRMRETAKVLEDLGVGFEITIASAHRTPDRVEEYVRSAPERGIEVFIAGAGGAAHLAGVVASLTTLPVIGVPLSGSALGGVDALYATVQMPSGVPVATVAVDGAKNAGILAVQILALKYPDLMKRLVEYRKGLTSTVVEKARRLEELGLDGYQVEAK